ncbi:hypothetical protein V757_01140 [Pelistega indica]|uniref:Bacteriophage protein n=1 Tax=Pelistega indica TaxID=1414851 RepID=V8G9A6_9BURK|nr:hypothetical protein [Pelistega indica]ETD72975.1 hypothetical protein V757_01140 [Pelistega indica]
MRVRRLDSNHDWTFGSGYSNYAQDSEAIAQAVKTRLWSFKGDWFLDLEHGIPWFEQMERVDLKRLEVPLMAYILETDGVKQIDSFTMTHDSENRKLLIEVSYTDIFE